LEREEERVCLGLDPAEPPPPRNGRAPLPEDPPPEPLSLNNLRKLEGSAGKKGAKFNQLVFTRTRANASLLLKAPIKDATLPKFLSVIRGSDDFKRDKVRYNITVKIKKEKKYNNNNY